jgi:hypothetical protein
VDGGDGKADDAAEQFETKSYVSVYHVTPRVRVKTMTLASMKGGE